MSVKVNKEKCLGCGTCANICPEVFEMGEDGKARVKADADAEKNKEKVSEAISACPVEAINQE